MTGAELRDIRNRLGFTVAEAAVMFGCDERTIKRWQAGHTPVPESVALALRALLYIDQHEVALPLRSSWRDIVPGLPSTDRRWIVRP